MKNFRDQALLQQIIASRKIPVALKAPTFDSPIGLNPGSPGLLAPKATGAESSGAMRTGASFGSPGLDGVPPGLTVGLSGLGLGLGLSGGTPGARSNMEPSPSRSEVCTRLMTCFVDGSTGSTSVQYDQRKHVCRERCCGTCASGCKTPFVFGDNGTRG